MARLPRIAVVNIPHHVTERGNARQFLLVSNDERSVYIDLLQRYTQLYQLSLLGYCLMSNHVHLLVIPLATDSLSQALKHAHGRYASYWNATHGSSGHVWQGRFYSCPLDDSHLWIALRYVELNPVRAGLVPGPTDWPWSSAQAHCGCAEPRLPLAMPLFARRWSTQSWSQYLSSGESDAELIAIRSCTHNGRPLGSASFLHSLEQQTHRHLSAKKGGRPSKSSYNSDQRAFRLDR